MKKEELVELLKFLNSYYQQRFEFPKKDKSDSKMMIETWYMFLKDYKYEEAMIITRKLVTEKEWPPNPGEIMKEIEKLKAPATEKITAEEAWLMVNNAIEKHSYFYQPEKVREVLPDRVLRAAETVGLDLIANEGQDSYIMNAFIKAYKGLSEREEKTLRLPTSHREAIQELTQKYTQKAIEGEKNG